MAVTDLFPFANQCPRQAIRLYTDQSETERTDSFFFSRTIFLVLFSSQPTFREHLTSSQDRPLSHPLLRIPLGTPSLKNTLPLASHTEEPALQSVTRAICYSDKHFLQTQGPTYEVPSISFQTFFVQAFKIIVDFIHRTHNYKWIF